MQRILLTGARAPAALHMARILHEQGHLVFAADSCHFPMLKFSKVIEQFFTIPSPVTHSNDFKNQLLSLVRQHKINWIIPTCEEVLHHSQHLDDLKRECQVLTDNLDLLLTFHNKWEFSKLINDTDVQCPETHLIQTDEDLKHWRTHSRDVVFKPVYSRFAAYTLIRPTPDQCAQIPVSEEAPWIAQTFIPGKEFSSYSIAYQGRISLHSSYYSLYRAGKGAGIYFQAHQSERIEAFVKRFAEKHKYTGQLAFDFIENAEGQLYVLECNPRLTSGIHLFNRNAASAILNENQSDLPCYPETLNNSPMLSSMMWFYGIHQKPFRTFWKDLKKGQDVTYSSYDSISLFHQGLSISEMFYRTIKHRCNLLEATTMDIAWNSPRA